jgi:hypothetical protein
LPIADLVDQLLKLEEDSADTYHLAFLVHRDLIEGEALLAEIRTMCKVELGVLLKMELFCRYPCRLENYIFANPSAFLRGVPGEDGEKGGTLSWMLILGH